MKNTVYQTLQTLVKLCLFRGSPSDLPFSFTLLFFLMFLELALNTVSWRSLPGASFGEIFLASLLSLAALTGIVYLLLASRKMQLRFNKVMIAWVGTEVLMELLLKLCLFVLPDSVIMVKQVQAAIGISFYVWNIFIKALIFKRSLEMKMASSVLIIFGIMVVSSLPAELILRPYLPQFLMQS